MTRTAPDRSARRRVAAARLAEVSLAPGDYIVRQHDEARYLFVLLSGSVRFLLRFEGVDDLLVATSTDSEEFIGWSTFRVPYRYTATVQCEGPCRLVRLPREDLVAIVREDPSFGYVLLKTIAARLATRLEQTRDLLVAPPWLRLRVSGGFEQP